MKHLRTTTLILILAICGIPTIAQVRQSPTPLIVNLITSTPFAQQSIATVTPTFTATPRGPVLLEARESAGTVNVRAEPDPNGERLGGIAFGTQYPALRQYFSWYEIQYDLSPSGRAWVYGELVEIIGDANEIEVVDTLEIVPTQNAADVQATETWIAITSAPGGLQTATASARVLSVPTTVNQEILNDTVLDSTPLPTYTYPPDVAGIVPTAEDIVIIEDDNIANEVTLERIPPLFPIILLGGLGIIGLLLNSLRR